MRKNLLTAQRYRIRRQKSHFIKQMFIKYLMPLLGYDTKMIRLQHKRTILNLSTNGNSRNKTTTFRYYSPPWYQDRLKVG